MRLLLDESIDDNLRFHFPGHECQTVRFAKLSGFKNGRLLSAVESLGFDVLITIDQHLPEQQNLANRPISVLIFASPTNRLSDLLPLIPQATAELSQMQCGTIVRIC